MINGKPLGSGKGQRLGQFIWQVADLLRGDYKPADYGTVILPFTVLRRLDCILEKTKPEVLKAAAKIRDLDNLRADDELKLQRASQYKFFNTSKFDFAKLVNDAPGIRGNLENYISGFSANVRDIFERYKFDEQIDTLNEKDLLYQIVLKFGTRDIDLHPTAVDNHDMGTAFEYLIRKFNELSNETAGDHYTPRDAIHLLIDVLLAGDSDLLKNPSPLRTVYYPAAGTGGMLSIAEDRIKEYNKSAKVTAYAQELNDESYAICKADMLFKGQDITNVVQGNTLSDDKFANKHFDLMACNPPYGVDWKKVRKQVEEEHVRRGFKGRFGPGLPRVSDGQMLFLLHLVSKMRALVNGGHGSRIGIVMNGSPLFTGGAGSGESEIRRYLLENDYVDAIIALPTDIFYNTGIPTYIWILSNNKASKRRGRTQLIDGSAYYQSLRRNLGNKRRELNDKDIRAILELYEAFEVGEHCKILQNQELGYTEVTIERPLRLNFRTSPERVTLLDHEKTLLKGNVNLTTLKDAVREIPATKIFNDRKLFLNALDAALRKHQVQLKPAQYKALWLCLSERDDEAVICTDRKGSLEPDPDLRDTEQVPLGENIDAYFAREVQPFAPDAWMDRTKDRVGYEIPFTRYFYKFVAPPPIEEIESNLRSLVSDVIESLNGLTT